MICRNRFILQTLPLCFLFKNDGCAKTPVTLHLSIEKNCFLLYIKNNNHSK